MANIPLVQVPNAPQTGSTAVPLPVGAIRTPDIEFAGMVEDASYMAIGRAYENLGAAGQQAASVLNDFGFSMARASDEANINRADDVKTTLMAEFEAEVATKPENEWSNIWDSKYADRLATEVGDMQMMTREGAARRDSWLQSQQTAIRADVFTKSSKAMIGRARMESDNAYERKIAAEDWEGAAAVLARRTIARLGTPEEEERDMLKMESVQKQKTRERLFDNAQSEMTVRYADPTTNLDEVREDLNNALQTGESKFFPEFNNAPDKARADFLKLLSVNDQLSNRAEADRYTAGINEVLSNKYRTVEELRASDGYKTLPKARQIQLESAFMDTPEERQRRLSHRPAILQKIKEYNPAKDDKHTRLWEIQGEIQMLPEGNQQDLREMLFKKWRDGNESREPKPSRAIDQVRSQMVSMLNSGAFGKFALDKETKAPTKQTEGAWMQANQRYSEIMDDVDGWAEANPKEASDARNVYKFLNDTITKYYEVDRRAGRATTRPPMLQAPKPQDVLRDVQRLRQGKAPASIRNNNAGAMWYVGGWQKKFGAEFGQKLNDGLGQGNQIANFPTPVHGAAALLYQLNRPSYVGKNVRGAIGTWSGGNNVGSYLSVLRSAGFTPDQSVSEIMASPESAVAFAKAMARHEAGTEYPMSEEEWRQAYDMFRNA
jgi:hypothetical protein